MPPKRRGGADGGGGKRSKLAKENNISAPQESEIREVFGLFAEPRKGEKEGAMPISDVRRAMIALNIPPTPSELAEFISILDPEDEGFAVYASFLAICALKYHQRTEDEDQEEHDREVDEAFSLFLTPPAQNSGLKRHASSSGLSGGDGGVGAREGSTSFVRGDSWVSNASSTAAAAAAGRSGEREKSITVANLKRIATILKEDVDEQLLRDMILEANGGVGVGRGVKKEEFEVVMRKAGVWR
ncbi:calmodulin [Zalerion maritima]|uniref:Calmodulin n=1 Tax=Zalerion maritima TaxID=339359 RepID=A0AAD5WY58_9PEZI|nr:calmodulin [Zalerion maritima]